MMHLEQKARSRRVPEKENYFGVRGGKMREARSWLMGAGGSESRIEVVDKRDGSG